METRANYVLIGAFTLAGVLGLLGFLVWIARLQIDRQYDYYDVLFENVTGLSRAADVRYNGLSVGQVISLGIDTQDPSKVSARIEVVAGTPIRDDTTVQLQAQGVTGVSIVALTGGSADAPLLRTTVSGIPRIVAQRSVIEALTQDAPDLVAEAITLLKNLQQFIGPENQGYVAGILKNLEQASGSLQTALTDFSKISGTIEEAAGQVGDFTGRLDEIGTSVKSALSTTERTLKSADSAFAEAETTLSAATGAIQSAGRSFDGAEAVIRDQVPGIVADLSATVAELRTAVTDIGSAARGTLAQFDTAAGLASDRLTEMQKTLTDLDATLAEATKTLAAVESASTSFETLIDGEGAALVADARKTLADAETSISAIDKVVTEDVPVIVADVRGAVGTASRVIEQVGADVSGFTGELKPLTDSAETTLATATQTLRDASGTLAQVDTAMDTAERTLVAAEATFTGANRIIDQEVAPTAADIRAAAERLGTAVTEVSDDLPAITAELRVTLARATAVIARIDRTAAASAPPVQEFATTGLPQFVRFTQEARALIVSLERIAARLERDPARFLLGGRAPDYRR